MRSMQQWFDDYGVSHKNATNKTIHWICVHVIFFSVIGLLAAIPHGFMSGLFPDAIAPFVHFGTVFIVFGLLFFLRLSVPIAIGMLLVSFTILFLQTLLMQQDVMPFWLVNTGLFVLAWIGQFIGHNIEGEKPSFLDDLQFLLIGPAWLLHFIYRKVGLSY